MTSSALILRWFPSFIKITLCLSAACALARPIHANAVFLPESRHQQFLTYALFTEEHSALLIRDSGRAWGSLGGAITLFEESDWLYHPQLVLHGSANSAFRFNPTYLGLLTETTDARAGLAVELSLSEQMRLSIGWLHASGHISDDVTDRRLIGPNLGNDYLPLRLIYDIPSGNLGGWRLGLTVRPLIGSDPPMKPLALDQFIEWFPFGVTDNPRAGTLFLTAGFEEYGSDQYRLTTTLQGGIYFGNHTRPQHHTSLRLLVGYYSGWDPSLKYAQFELATTRFAYTGINFDF